MANTVVVGAMWGDESKGKLIDFLAHDKDVVVRWGGGSNAGHTVVVPSEGGGEEEYKLHLVPSGILHPNTLCVVADGVVLDPASFVGELTMLKARGVSCENLKISGNVHIVLPYHVLLDELEEKRKGKRALGTTGRGIGPAYQDKAARVGIRMREFVDPALFAERLSEVSGLQERAFDQSVRRRAPLRRGHFGRSLAPCRGPAALCGRHGAAGGVCRAFRQESVV